jgi:hypothetical protein
MKVMNEENQNFADYVSQIDETQLATDYASKLSGNEVIYDSDYNDSTFDPDSIESVAVYPNESAAVCNLNSCDLDDGELTCGDDFAYNGETIQGGPCQDLIEYFSDKPYLD